MVTSLKKVVTILITNNNDLFNNVIKHGFPQISFFVVCGSIHSFYKKGVSEHNRTQQLKKRFLRLKKLL